MFEKINLVYVKIIEIRIKNAQSPKRTQGKTMAIATIAVIILVRIDTTASLLSSFG